MENWYTKTSKRKQTTINLESATPGVHSSSKQAEQMFHMHIPPHATPYPMNSSIMSPIIC